MTVSHFFQQIVSMHLPTAYVYLGQVVGETSLIMRIIDAGGSKAIAAAAMAVVVYLAKENRELHNDMHKRDVDYATKLHEAHVAHASAIANLQNSHATELSRVTEQRIEEMENVTKAVGALDNAVRLLESWNSRGKR